MGRLVISGDTQTKPSDPYGTGHLGLSTGRLVTSEEHPRSSANYRQAVARQLKLLEGLTKPGRWRTTAVGVARLMRAAVGGG